MIKEYNEWLRKNNEWLRKLIFTQEALHGVYFIRYSLVFVYHSAFLQQRNCEFGNGQVIEPHSVL